MEFVIKRRTESGKRKRINTRIYGYSDSVFKVAISPDGKLLASGAADRLIGLWNIEDPKNPKLIKRLPHDGYVVAVEFSPNGEYLISGARDNTVRIWDVKKPEEAKLIASIEHGRRINALAISPKAPLIAVGSMGKKIFIWDISNPERPELLSLIESLPTYPSNLAFSPDGKFLAADCCMGKIPVWNVEDPERPELILKLHAISSRKDDVTFGVAFSPDGRFLATGINDGTIGLRDISDIEKPKKIYHFILDPDDQHYLPVLYVTFSPDGKILASASADWRIGLREINDDVILLIRRLRGHTDLVNSLTFSPDGKLLASASNDGRIGLRNFSYLFDKVYDVRAVETVYSSFYRPEAPKVKTLLLKLNNADNPEEEDIEKCIKEFPEEPIITLKCASRKGILDRLVEALLKEGLIEEKDGKYYVKPYAEMSEGEVIEEELDEELLDKTLAEIVFEISRLMRLLPKSSKLSFLKKLIEMLEREIGT